MDHIISNIQLAFNHFLVYGVLFTIPFLLMQVARRKFNFVRMGINYAFLFYSITVAALVFFPLPTLAEQASLSGHASQLVPFHFVKDIVDTTPFVWTNPHTYVSSVLNKTVLQVVFNIFMTVPFGMYLRYNFHFNAKKVFAASAFLTAFIEIGQLTGLFFLFNGSYRLFDVDDLMLNTLGGMIGYAVVKLAEKYVPAVEQFDMVKKETALAAIHSK